MIARPSPMKIGNEALRMTTQGFMQGVSLNRVITIATGIDM
jgi:hypothetical protein